VPAAAGLVEQEQPYEVGEALVAGGRLVHRAGDAGQVAA
jgi:hypothetical protein